MSKMIAVFETSPTIRPGYMYAHAGRAIPKRNKGVKGIHNLINNTAVTFLRFKFWGIKTFIFQYALIHQSEAQTTRGIKTYMLRPVLYPTSSVFITQCVL